MATVIEIPDTESEVKPVTHMTERELLEELVSSARELRVAIAGAGVALASNPMLKMFGGSLGSLLGGK